MNTSYSQRLHTVVSIIALSVATAATAQSPNTSKTDARDVSFRPSTEMATGPGFTLEFASISKGGAVLPDGSIVIVGQPFVGTASSEEFTIEMGIVPSLTAASICPVSSAPVAERIGPDVSTKNRYASFTATDIGRQQAIRVTFVDCRNHTGTG